LKILTVIGTRPEAIKLAPVLLAFAARPDIRSIVCVTGQHRDLVEPVLSLFGIKPDHDLGLMRPDQNLNELVSSVVAGVDALIGAVAPDWVVVQGDTTSAMGGAMAAFGRKIPVAHVEAGLRTHNLRSPWPEEMNRRAVDAFSDLLFAPTLQARENLLLESVPGRIVVTGNTVIDALQACARKLTDDDALRDSVDAGLPVFDPAKRLLLVTGHRRENMGKGVRGVCKALLRLSAREDLEIVYVLHPNPNVQGPVRRALEGHANIHLAPPQDYLAFIRLMQRADVILTDSGGVQEEAPALGKPVIVTREVTERQEAAAAGSARLVGVDPDLIFSAVSQLLDNPKVYARQAAERQLFGDGAAAARIVRVLAGQSVDAWQPASGPRLVAAADDVMATRRRA
jgi:UDP-N-acetylglucosamine 2-epimerase (non-hydrolysing)